VREGFPLWWADPSRPAPPFQRRNHKGAFAHADFVTRCIAELLTAGAIAEVPTRPKVVNPLNAIPKKNGKFRLLLDLRHVNSYLQVPKFKYDSLKMFESLAARGDVMFSIDLLSGYHQCEMHPNAWEYLGLEWQGKFYVFKVLPFGLSSAPWCFTKLMREVAGFLRLKGVKLIAYVDDFCFICPGLNLGRARTIRHLVLNTFEAAGLQINLDKSHLEFSPALQHLGFLIDLERGLFIVPAERWARLQVLVSSALEANKATVRTLAKIGGHLSSMSLALGPVARLFSRACYRPQASHGMNFVAKLDPELRDELLFWKKCDRESYSTPIWRGPTVADVHLASDAGGRSWGAVLGDKVA